MKTKNPTNGLKSTDQYMDQLNLGKTTAMFIGVSSKLFSFGNYSEDSRSRAFVKVEGWGYIDIGRCLIIYVGESVSDPFLAFYK